MEFTLSNKGQQLIEMYKAMGNDGFRKTKSYPVYRGKDWIDSENFVTE